MCSCRCVGVLWNSFGVTIWSVPPSELPNFLASGSHILYARTHTKGNPHRRVEGAVSLPGTLATLATLLPTHMIQSSLFSIISIFHSIFHFHTPAMHAPRVAPAVQRTRVTRMEPAHGGRGHPQPQETTCPASMH